MSFIGGIGDSVKVRVWNPDTLAYEVMTQPVVKTDEMTVAGEMSVSNFPASYPVTGTFWQTTQPVSVGSLPLPEGAATSAKQLADNHQVSVSNFPATQPVSAAALPLPSGAATEGKQDSLVTAINNLITELQLKADLTETQPTGDVNYDIVFRRLLEAVQHPEYYNGVSNALQALLITGSTTAVTGTLTGVTTVTGLTNIGGVGADMVVWDISADTWGINIRSLLS